jgi:hypothetical protein
MSPPSEDVSDLKIYYIEPRAELLERGVESGTVLLEGTFYFETSPVGGDALVFKKGCKPLSYRVTGSVKGDFESLTLKGPAPVFSKDGCAAALRTSPRNSTLEFISIPNRSSTRAGLRKPRRKSSCSKASLSVVMNHTPRLGVERITGPVDASTVSALMKRCRRCSAGWLPMTSPRSRGGARPGYRSSMRFHAFSAD